MRSLRLGIAVLSGSIAVHIAICILKRGSIRHSSHSRYLLEQLVFRPRTQPILHMHEQYTCTQLLVISLLHEIFQLVKSLPTYDGGVNFQTNPKLPLNLATTLLSLGSPMHKCLR